ncbi:MULTISPECIES: hypothetical protein [unclassified Endozoicomonas]|uniref:hypothetical protein n=1 Tax=unclassified Endozoicomonas TaxID=2644528 RepID=UPI003BB72814
MNKKEIEDFLKEENNKIDDSEKIEPASEHKVVSNHSGYSYEGSENYEHDDNGSLHNYSGVVDEFDSAESEHEGWENGYDF